MQRARIVVFLATSCTKSQVLRSQAVSDDANCCAAPRNMCSKRPSRRVPRMRPRLVHASRTLSAKSTSHRRLAPSRTNESQSRKSSGSTTSTVLVPCAFCGGTHPKATHVRAPDGTVLPFASVRDARAAWHHLAVHCASSSPPKAAATSKKKKEAAAADPPAAAANAPPSPPITVFDPLPEVLPALPLARPPPEEEEEERVLRSRVIKRPRVA